MNIGRGAQAGVPKPLCQSRFVLITKGNNLRIQNKSQEQKRSTNSNTIMRTISFNSNEKNKTSTVIHNIPGNHLYDTKGRAP